MQTNVTFTKSDIVSSSLGRPDNTGLIVRRDLNGTSATAACIRCYGNAFVVMATV